MNSTRLLLQLALDLTQTLASEDRLQRMLQAIRVALASDAAALLVLERDRVRIRASHGLSEEGRTKSWSFNEQPRLETILESDRYVIFPDTSTIPDPFDGLLAGVNETGHLVHSCLGIPLRVDGVLLGCVTADALRRDAFTGFGSDFLETVGALASATLKSALERELLETETTRKAEWAHALVRERDIDFIGNDPVTLSFKSDLAMVARSNVQILLMGETGVGKEVAARAAHKLSDRAKEPFVAINCAAIPESMMESELFGHEKGAFTGAESARPGRFEVADGGTLFLDEIGELPLPMQASLLRVLQEGEIQRLGSDRPVKVDVRLIAATNKDLREEVNQNRFRADLFHRIAVFPIVIPPLRDRRGDIPVLAREFLKDAQRDLRCGPISIDDDAMERLGSWNWPGNVRELRNVIFASALRANHRSPHTDTRITVSDIREVGVSTDQNGDVTAPAFILEGADLTSPRSLKLRMDEYKSHIILAILEQCGGNWAEAAKQLEIDKSNLHHLAKRLGLK